MRSTLPPTAANAAKSDALPEPKGGTLESAVSSAHIKESFS
jgi:hypothetical protein